MTGNYGYYRGGWDALIMRDMLAIPLEPDRDKEETFEHELHRRGVSTQAFILAWALSGGIVPAVRKDDGYCNTYNGQWKPNEELDAAYRLLESLGYVMSDLEKGLQKGTDMFFTEGEVK